MTRASDNGPGEPFYTTCAQCDLEVFEDHIGICLECGEPICDECIREHDCEPDPEDA